MNATTNSGGVRALICALAALTGVACGDSDPVAPVPAPTQEVRENDLIVVSEPVPLLATVPVVNSAAAPDISDADTVAYVSFAPRTFPRADRATITHLASGYSITTPVVDGGLDPVPAPGAAGDTLEIRLLKGTAQLGVFLPTIPFFRPPRVVRTQPMRGKRDLPLNSSIIIVFSEPVDSVTVTRGGIGLLKADQPVAIDVIVAADRLSARAVPRAPLEPGTQYVIVVTRSVRDLSGDSLEQEYRSDFATTGSSATPLRFASVAAGYNHTCGISTSGRPYCWGGNWWGQLGDGTTVGTGMPQPVAGLSSVPDLSARGHRTCAKRGASGYCWGSNHATVEDPNGIDGWIVSGGLIPTADTAFDGLSPTRITFPGTLATMRVGGAWNCGFGATGALYCWGWVEDPHPADPDFAIAPTYQFSADSSWFLSIAGPALTALSVGNQHMCGLDAGGIAYCRGFNRYGQLGNGARSSVYYSDPAAPVAGGLSFQSISAGDWYTCGVTVAGEAYCWGANDSGQLGNGSTVDSDIPVPVGGGLTFTSVAAGVTHTCGVAVSGDAYCWGAGSLGQLGDGTIYSSQLVTSPVKVAGGLSFSEITVGLLHTCGITTTGIVYCWGDNMHGALGTGYPSGPQAVPAKAALQ